MGSRAPSITLILSIILLSATTMLAIDITKLLQEHGEFSTFSDLLTQTGLATNINNRQTITVLVVDNSGMQSITSKPREVAKNILATHIVLDYYDTKKLGNLKDKSATVTTLFQATGAANGKQGYLKVTVNGNDIKLGSAVDKAPQNAKVIKSVLSEPYNVSVIQISEPIMTPGIDQVSPAGAPKKAQSPAEHSKAPKSEDTKSHSKDDSETSPSPNGSTTPEEESADNKSTHHNGAIARNVGIMLPASLLGFLALAF